jgi:hypothetical protein
MFARSGGVFHAGNASGGLGNEVEFSPWAEWRQNFSQNRMDENFSQNTAEKFAGQ